MKNLHKKPYFFALSHINDYNFNTYKNKFEKKLKKYKKNLLCNIRRK